MKIDPNPAHVQAVRERMMTMARNGPGRRRRTRSAWMVGLVLCGACGAGLTATETGRKLIGLVFTPVQTRHTTTVVASDGTNWILSGSAETYSSEQLKAATDQFDEVAKLKENGLGELVALIEHPDYPLYMVKYTLKDGTAKMLGSLELTDKQAVNMQMEEIQRLRDAGAGDLLVQSPSPIGLGQYTIRFTLADRTVDLQTWYPPSTREQREAIFAETRKLKADLRFSVLQAGVSPENPEEGVVGTLQYTLADGRIVGIAEKIPPDAITPDGTQVVVPHAGETVSVKPGGTWTAPDGTYYTMSGVTESDSPDEQEAVVDKFHEVYAIKKAGGGQLVGLIEHPGFTGELSATTFQVKYTFDDGETMTVGESDFSGVQRTTLRIDEVQRLRDAGAGEVISQAESPQGLGRFTIRFAFSDGETVDLQTVYPPGTRQERDAIFAETRELKAQRLFSVTEARVAPGAGVWGRLVYSLSDGRSVVHYEPVPTDLISSDGRRIAIPGTGEFIDIAGLAGN